MTELAEVSPATIVIVGGDFNAAADAEEFVNVNSPSDGRLVDCRRLAGLPAAVTCAGNGNGVCIDHILVQVWKDMEDWRVFDVSTVLNRPDPETGLLASDHFGVQASIILNSTLRV